MDETMHLDYAETPLRTIFNRGHLLTASTSSLRADAAVAASSGEPAHQQSAAALETALAAGDPAAKPDIDPLYPSLDAELPKVHRPQRQIYRPHWDPRERWRQLKPSQPWHAPPESDLPAQFRYEDLSMYENSETMDIHEDRLLRWLVLKFENGLEYKNTWTGDTEPPVREQKTKSRGFNELQILDQQLENLGLTSLRQPQPKVSVSIASETEFSDEHPTTSRSGRPSSYDLATSATTSGPALSRKTATSEESDESETEEFGAYASPSPNKFDNASLAQTTQTVVTVHEASHLSVPSMTPSRRPRKHHQHEALVDWAAGDVPRAAAKGGVTGGSSVRCELNIHSDWSQSSQSHHRVQQFGDAGARENGSVGYGGKKIGKRRNLADESV